ncbi:MAG: pknB 10 [Acidobacteria bacterium]|jgi:serine/threonine protein kinase|nr:pknB 10 [Acidobacteriota bacterium]
MKVNRWETVEKVFNKSVVLPREKREAFVASACGGDADLIEDVLSLLAEADKDDKFLSEPVFEVGAKILASEYIGLFDEPNFAAYEMQKILGRGGSSVVFLARDVSLERSVAIKVLPAALADDDERILRFQQEAKAASAISHPNVAHIYGFGKADNRYYLAMEYVQGDTLRELLKKKEIDKVFALDIACQISKALCAAHKAGIVHRDVKPENIIVADDGLVKVLDFGLAKSFTVQNRETNRSFDASLDTKPGMIIGTVSYMSPEQIRGQQLDWRTDIWSFGVVLYEMLAGSRPFKGETSSDIQARILLIEHEYPAEIAEMPEIRKILDKCLAKDVNLRYKATPELMNDLEIFHKYLSYPGNKFKYSFAANAESGEEFENFEAPGYSEENPEENKETKEANGEKGAKPEIIEGKPEKNYAKYKLIIAAAVFFIFIIVLIAILY